MKIGVIREIKDKKNQAGLTAYGAKALVDDEHSIMPKALERFKNYLQYYFIFY